MRTLTLLLGLTLLSGCNDTEANRHVTVKEASKLEDKVDAIWSDKHKLYVCLDKYDKFSDFKDCVKRGY